MELLEAIEIVEKAHFRTHQDTGANFNAMVVQNHFRRLAGLPRLSTVDLIQRALDDYTACIGRAVFQGDLERAAQYQRAAQITLGELIVELDDDMRHASNARARRWRQVHAIPRSRD